MKKKNPLPNCLMAHLKILNNGFTAIFEPLPKVKLTRSSYQVMTFLDFLPFLQGFAKVSEYIENFKQDLDNPDYIHKILMRIENVELAFQNDMEMSRLLESSGCHVRPTNV